MPERALSRPPLGAGPFFPGHAGLALDLLRRDAGLRALFQERYGR